MSKQSNKLLIKLLDDHRVECASILKLFETDPWSSNYKATARFSELVSKVEDAMRLSPEFAEAKSAYFFGAQVLCEPWSQSRNLLAQAAQTSGACALDWYRRVLGVSTASVDVVLEVYGLTVGAPVSFSNGVRLVPIEHLKDDVRTRALLGRQRFASGLTPFITTAAVLTFANLVMETSLPPNDQRFQDAVDKIRNTVLAITLSAPITPTTGASWTEFQDPDLRAATFGRLTYPTTAEGRIPLTPRNIDPAAVDWVERVLKLSGKTLSACEVAISRLNQAFRRHSPGDQAIDACIALEALLGDGQNDNLTYKLRLRAARLIGKDLSERLLISNVVSALYQVRSRVVHGQSKGKGPDERNDASAGLDLTLKILRRIVTDGRLPVLIDLELGHS